MPRAAAGAQGYDMLRGQWVGVERLQELEPLHAQGLGEPTNLIFTPGNIRVLCRLKPGTYSSLLSSEPGPGGTVTTCYRGHQRHFRLDWVFPPNASQEEVMLCPSVCDPPSGSPGVQERLWFPFPVCCPPGERVAGLQQGREGSQRAWEAGLAA